MKRMTVIAVLVSCVFSSAAWSGEYTIGVEGVDNLPVAKGEGSNYSGYARELLDAFAAKYDHQFTYSPLPVARLMDEFAVKKSLDFKYPDNPHWAGGLKKGSKIAYSAGTVTVIDGLFVKPENKGKGLENIKTIATQRGFTPFPYLAEINASKIRVYETNSMDAAIRMGDAGRVDGIFMGQVVANYLMNEVLKKPGMLVFDDKLPNEKSEYSLATIKHTDVIKQFDEFLSREKNTVARLKAKYKIIE